MKKTLVCALLALTAAAVLSAGGSKDQSAEKTAAVPAVKKAKNIILLIGDGMGTPEIAAADAYLGATDNDDSTWLGKQSWESFPHQGLTTTYAADRFITDSAAAGTAIACGQKTYCGAISIATDHATKLKSIAEYSRDAGKAVGIVTTTRVTHATPAVFISHNVDRDAENEIAEDEAAFGVDFLAGGGYRNFVGKDNAEGLKSKRKDDRDLVKEMQAAGYKTFISEKAMNDFTAYTPKKDDKVLALLGASHLEYEIDRQKQRDQPTLAALTDKALQTLTNNSKTDKNGYFLMVEGGRIDHAGHANDAKTNIVDTLAFNDAVKVALSYYRKDPENTLIIVTADHETGGLTLGFAGTEYESAYSQLVPQDVSYEGYQEGGFAAYKKAHKNDYKLSDLEGYMADHFGLSNLTGLEKSQLEIALKRSMDGEEVRSPLTEDYLLYGGYEPFIMQITHILNNRAGLAWTSYSHTAAPVATFAIGPGSEQINGTFDNTDIFNYMYNAYKL